TRFGDALELHRVRHPVGARTQLTFFADPVSGASYQPGDGRYIVLSKDVGGGEFFQKYRYDVATGDVTLLTDGKSRNVGGVWSHKGDRYAYMSTRRNGRDLDLWVMDPADPRTDRLVVELTGGGFAPLDWSPDDRTLLLHQAISVNESDLWLADAATGVERRLPKLPAGLIGNVTWRRTGAELGFSFSSARSVEDAYSLDLLTGRLERWTESETGGLNPADFTEPELIHWPSADGR